MIDTLKIIIDELRRQADASRAGGLGYFDPENPREAVIDGRVDLVALSEALKARSTIPRL